MKIKKTMWGMLLLITVFVFCINMPVYAKTYKTYKISSTTKPCTNAYQKRAKAKKSYNATYMLKSYLDQIDKKGGGTLVFKKGTYNIYENLYIPSNTTLKFEKGVKIVAKGKSVAAIFNLIPPTKVSRKNYGKKYASSRNIKFTGADNVIFDLGTSSATAIYMAHNQKITIENIVFKKNSASRYILELNGVKDVNITNCKFTGTKAQKTTAISVDVPAKKRAKTKGWSANDDTMNQKVRIEKCTFTNLNRAICTLRYVGNKYNTDFAIVDNHVSNIKEDALRIINWKNFKITGNVIRTVGTGGTTSGKTIKLKRAIYLAGAVNPQVTGNTFEDIPRAIEFNIYTNADAKLKSYAATKNSFSDSQLQAMLDNNTLINNREYVIRVYSKQVSEGTADAEDGNDKGCLRYFYTDNADTYYISPDADPYKNEYMQYPAYNQYTKHYYAFRAIMDQLERRGGGTLIVKAGTYKLTNDIPVPSNVTIKLEDGVVMKKLNKTGYSGMKTTGGIFVFVEPKYYNSSESVVYYGYNGVHNVTITGPDSGTALIDLDGYADAMGLVIAHSNNLTIKNLTFKHGQGAHFIELDASKDVVITNCLFDGHKDSQAKNKEAINFDTPDIETGGFLRKWSSFDCTANLNIHIVNNTFLDQEVAIGTHSYSENHPHTNIFIENNKIDGCDASAIQMLNWDHVTIRGNTFSNISRDENGRKYALVIDGVKNPKIANNTIMNCRTIGRVGYAMQSGKSAKADAYAPVKYELTAGEWNDLLNTNKLVNVSDPTVWEYPVAGSDVNNKVHTCTSN